MNFKIALITACFFVSTSAYGQSRRVTIGIDKKSRDKATLEDNITKRIQSEEIELTLLVAGKLELYKYVDEKGELHFFLGENNRIEELYFEVFRNREGKVQYFEQYKQQLKNAFADCARKSTIPAAYTEQAMVAAFKTYYLCIGRDVDNDKPRKSELLPVISAAVLFSTFSFHSKTPAYDQILDDHTATSFVPSILLEHSPVGKRGVIYPQLGFSLRSINKLRSNNGVDPTISSKNRCEYVYDRRFLSVGFGAKYVIAKYQVARPYVRASLDLNIVAGKIGTRNEKINYRASGYYSTSIGSPNSWDTPMKPIMPFGFLVGFGVTTKNYDIEFGLDRQMFFYKGTGGSSLSMTSPYTSFSWRFSNTANKM